MSKLANSWRLFTVSWGVLRADKSLAAFPVLGGIASVVVAGASAGLIWLTSFEDTTTATGSTSTSFEPIGWVFVALTYLALAFVVVYFQAALTAAADRSLREEHTTVRDGLREANARIGVIFGWAVVIATVNMILQAIEERAGFVGRIVASLLGAGWNILTFLALPVIVLERVGPVTALKRSGSLLKATWGENIVAQVGLGVVGVLAMLPAVVVGGLAVATGNLVVVVPVVALAAVWVLLVAVVMSALGGIYRVALYRFAVDHTPPAAFAGADFEHVFGPRRHRRS